MSLRGLGVLQVEPTDHCNLSCTMCAPHHEGWAQVHRIPKGYLDPVLWECVVQEMAAESLEWDHIIFQWLGDPSLHPALPALIRTAAVGLAGRVSYLRLDTNAILLSPSRIDALLAGLPPDGPPLLIVLTIDAATPQTYAAVKGRDGLARVQRHARHLIRRRRASGARVNLQLQFVVQEGNHHEVGPFLAYWSDLLACQGGADWHDEVMFKRLSVGGGAAGQAAADARYEAALAAAGVQPGRRGAVEVLTWQQRPWQQDDGHTGRSACPGLWLTPVIRHDGSLMMCCADLGGELALGSLRETSFSSLWWGAKAIAKRRQHLAGRFEGVCAGCGGINWYALSPERIASGLAR